MAIRDAVPSRGIEVRAGLHTGECEVRGDDIGGIAVHIGARVSALAGAERGAGVQHAARPGDRVRARVRGPRRSRAQGCARRVAPLRGRISVAVGCGETDFACRKRLCTGWMRQRHSTFKRWVAPPSPNGMLWSRSRSTHAAWDRTYPRDSS